MIKRMSAIIFLLVAVFSFSIFAQQKTEILDAKARTMLLGRHKLSLQWISWDYFGTATVTQRNGQLLLTGKQTGRGDSSGDYVTVNGVITSIDTKEFKFNGKIIVKVSHNNNGEPCLREGEMTFKITGNRKYWRLQEMDNPCEGITDYVDIFFK